MKYYVSFDIGGTFIKYGIINEKAEIVFTEKIPTESGKGGWAIIEKVIKTTEKLSKEYSLSGICISTAGMVDTEKGSIFHAGKQIPDYKGTEIKRILSERFSIPCEVENDVNCAGLAEAVSGAAKNKNPAVCITVGTGIGGCLIIDGKIFHGFSFSACEVGYMHLDKTEFQSKASVVSLIERVSEKSGIDKSELNGKIIVEKALLGDRICMEALEEMIDALACGIANICYVVNPQVVVLGGGIMSDEEFFKQRIIEALKKYLIPIVFEKTEIKIAEHKNNAGILGAFYNFISINK